MRRTTERVLIGGLYAGLLGYATVVIVSAALNVLTGRSPFYTVAMLGSGLFYGLERPDALVIRPGPVLAYNMVHLLVFLAIGLVASWLVTLAERHVIAIYGILVLLLVVAAHLYGALVLFAEPLLGAWSWWHLGVASLAAAAVMAWYLWRAHPALRRALREVPMGEVPEDAGRHPASTGVIRPASQGSDGPD